MHRLLLSCAVLLWCSMPAAAQLALVVHQTLSMSCGGCIAGVAISNPADKASWRVDYTAAATAEQKEQAQAALAAFDIAAPTFVQKLAAGLAVSSTGTPALDAIYAVDQASQIKIQAVALYISVNSRFPAGLVNFPWPDINGVPHIFPTTVQFQALATVIGDYVTVINLQAQQPNPVWPLSTVVIP